MKIAITFLAEVTLENYAEVRQKLGKQWKEIIKSELPELDDVVGYRIEQVGNGKQ